MFGYDWPRVHAMFVAFPIALLPIAVLFDLAGLTRKSEVLRRTGLTLLLIGTIAAGGAVLAGLQAEDAIDHGNAIHHLMEEHQTLAYFTLGTFAIVALWRLFRERKMGGKERIATFVLSLVGLGFLIDTGHHGGKLVFEHAAGVSNATLKAEMIDRGHGHVHGPGEAHHHDDADEDHDHAGDPHDEAAPADSHSNSDSATQRAPHTHPPGTPAHQD
jgi:uncharacterized membrane protein